MTHPAHSSRHPPGSAPIVEAWVGLMSGTSMDGVDAALVRFHEDPPRLELLASHSEAYPPPLRARLEQALTVASTAAEWSRLDAETGETFALAASALLARAPAGIEVCGIGCHGQTIWHEPEGPFRNSLQIGDPHRVAVASGLPVVADLRRADLARGGQGAPIASGFHAWALGPGPAGILNLGGIANLTALGGPGRSPIAYDTGPANTLMDRWTTHTLGLAYDARGEWAARGRVVEPLLERLLGEPWLARRPPRSTGRERFNLAWLGRLAGPALHDLPPADVQRTLLAFTVEVSAREIERVLPPACPIFVCGGGTRNDFLMHELATRLAGYRVQPSDDAGVPAQWMECAAFAWLARERLAGRPGNLPGVTGANSACLLGSRIDPLAN